MTRFWANRIRYDLSRIEEVPAYWREDVRAMIEKRNKELEA